MKVVALLCLATLFASVAARGQGQFYFNNRIGTEVNARFVRLHDAPGQSSIGSPDYTLQLWGALEFTPIAQYVPLDPPGTTFRGPAGSPTAGYVKGVTVTVPGVPVGGDASVVIRVWRGDQLACDLGPYKVPQLGEARSLRRTFSLAQWQFIAPYLNRLHWFSLAGPPWLACWCGALKADGNGVAPVAIEGPQRAG